jgi:FAD/FMN-containing dehydrogenase/Fe-S oxidoreductase
MPIPLRELAARLEGDLHTDDLLRHIYATDASVYREIPLAVAIPKTIGDIQRIIRFANTHKVPLIPRAAGTSLAGQCVGNGMVVDISKHFNHILEINPKEQWVRLEPGVIRDELNHYLKDYGLFFGPNTSTANRCMLGGMVGNNSCGSSSIVYGSTRDHVLEIKGFLSDGSEVVFEPLTKEEFKAKLEGETLEHKIYQQLWQNLSKSAVKKEIQKQYPKPSIQRRNTGYAIDVLLESEPFGGKEIFNLSKLVCGSEGTLAFITEIKLHVDPLPPSEGVLVSAHFENIELALKATLQAMAHQPFACELMDKIILDCTKGNIEQEKNRFFIEGDPKGVLMVEFRADQLEEANQKAEALIRDWKAANLGYAFPKLNGADINKAWNLRKAGLGLLSNIPGDAKSVACIEDTAVEVSDLPDYIKEFSQIMADFKQEAIYYAHAGAGELHLRPVLNLKEAKDIDLFRKISEASARLVKKYQGSLSGEHGDGRVRAEFIPLMIGEKNYELLKSIKDCWDPNHILNPGKIVNAPPMDQDLRYLNGGEEADTKTIFDFSESGGLLRMAEKCNGSGDCRKLPMAGGTMCPSYQATRNEKDTTRARANALREFLKKKNEGNPFYHEELKEVMDLCLSCKGCTSECPSNVDMAALKAEFQYQYYQEKGFPFRSRFIAAFGQLNRLGSIWPGLSNWVLSNRLTGHLFKRIVGFAPERSMPKLAGQTLRKWYKRHYQSPADPKRQVYFFCDEFTNYLDAAIGIKAIQLLRHLNYDVLLINHAESGRAHISKGLLKKARRMAESNVQSFAPIVSGDKPLLGLEPSAILGFRDEYPKLVSKNLQADASKLAKHCLLLEEFLYQEMQAESISSDAFTKTEARVLLHGHCHQKALSSVDYAAWILALPENYGVSIIPSGCCGMAGSFGYEKEHFDLSMKVGELVLFPTVREAKKNTLIAAPGTSCRHQILDGTGIKALHPVEILWEALVQ